MVTMRRVPFVLVEDYALVDLERLRPYLKPEHIEYAARMWAKATNYSEAMPGVIAEMRDATVIK